jgi:riboflavin synthase
VFTGIVQHVGQVAAVATTAAGKRLIVDVGPLAERLAPGSSLAVDGACLTVAGVSAARAETDVVPETLARTTLARLRPGDAVNLEPALAAGGALDGHIVQGHVDGLAHVTRIDRSPDGHVLHLTALEDLTEQMVPKGSIALAGVSLTIVDVRGGGFSVALVPTTLERTTLGRLRVGDPLNVELDILGKYVRRYLAARSGPKPLTLEALRRAGLA